MTLENYAKEACVSTKWNLKEKRGEVKTCRIGSLA
jgi:hypothetical protein